MTKLLIVDDNEQDLYMLQVLLEGNGYEVVLAANGAEALETARRDPPDVIISDILMPVMDGFTLCRQWKKDDRLKGIPFVLYTATYTDPKDEEFALSLGAERFIVKPEEPDVLVGLVREVIREAEAGRLAAPREPLEEEPVYLKQYSERLVKKLEDKMLQLEEANRALERELTERKRAEEALRESQRFIKEIADTAPNTMMYLYDLIEQRNVYVNRQIGEILGYTREEIQQMGSRMIEILVHPDDLESVTEHMKKVARDKKCEIIENEYRMKHANGEWRWLLSRDIVFTRDAAGLPTQNVGVAMDITERVRAEEALRESEERYRSLFNGVPVGINRTAPGGQTLNANPALVHMLGYPDRETLLAVNVTDLYVDPEDRWRWQALVEREGVVRGFEVQLRRCDGTTIWVRSNARAVCDASGRVLHYEGSLEDITERKLAEEEIGRLAKFPSENPNPVLRVAKDGAILYVNEASLPLLNVWGCQVGQPLPDYWRRFTVEVFSSGLSKDTEVEYEDRMLSLTFAPVVDAGYVNVYGLDITERKRAEEELQRTLERLREALGGIIQTVALTVETKDPYTAGHQRRVGNLARAIANEMGLPQEQIDGIRMAGLIHDLGKVGIPAEILSKPGRLSDFEWGIIKMHSQIGYDILKKIDFSWPVAQIVLKHHERLDGSGYPQGLSGEEIILEAKILAVADVVEAMASFRPYRPARGIDKALEEISQNSGILYDPEVVDACLKLFTENGFEFE